MSNKEQIIQSWIQKAEHDLGTAKLTYLHLPKYYDTIAFHCQQTVEKCIKALLIKFDTSFIRTHDLVYLVSLLADNLAIEESLIDSVIALNGFSVQIRYPNELIALTNEELEEAIATATVFYNLAVQTTCE